MAAGSVSCTQAKPSARHSAPAVDDLFLLPLTQFQYAQLKAFYLALDRVAVHLPPAPQFYQQQQPRQKPELRPLRTLCLLTVLDKITMRSQTVFRFAALGT